MSAIESHQVKLAQMVKKTISWSTILGSKSAGINHIKNGLVKIKTFLFNFSQPTKKFKNFSKFWRQKVSNLMKWRYRWIKLIKEHWRLTMAKTLWGSLVLQLMILIRYTKTLKWLNSWLLKNYKLSCKLSNNQSKRTQWAPNQRLLHIKDQSPPNRVKLVFFRISTTWASFPRCRVWATKTRDRHLATRGTTNHQLVVRPPILDRVRVLNSLTSNNSSSSSHKLATKCQTQSAKCFAKDKCRKWEAMRGRSNSSPKCTNE